MLAISRASIFYLSPQAFGALILHQSTTLLFLYSSLYMSHNHDWLSGFPFTW